MKYYFLCMNIEDGIFGEWFEDGDIFVQGRNFTEFKENAVEAIEMAVDPEVKESNVEILLVSDDNYLNVYQ